jgi:hypothetical protein
MQNRTTDVFWITKNMFLERKHWLRIFLRAAELPLMCQKKNTSAREKKKPLWADLNLVRAQKKI